MAITVDVRQRCSAMVRGGSGFSSYRGRQCNAPATASRTRTERVTETVKVYDEQTFTFSTERRDLGTRDVQEWFCSRHDPEAAAARRNKKDAAERAAGDQRERNYKATSDAGLALAERLKALGVGGIEQAWYATSRSSAYRQTIRPALTIGYSGIEALLARFETAEAKVREYES